MSFSPPAPISVSANWTREARQYQLVLQVEANSAGDGQIGAIRASGIPRIGDFYDFNGEVDQWSFCIGKTCARDKESKLFTVTLSYSTLDRERRKQFTNPLLRPAEISSTHRNVTVVAEYDNQGNKITNSAGGPFEPRPEKDSARKILTVTKNFALYDGGFSWIDTINSSAYGGASPRTLKVNVFDETRVIEQFGPEGSEFEVEYWKRTVAMEYKRDGWRGRYMDVGMRDNTGAALKVNGIPVTAPVLLDGNGAVLNPQTGQESYRTFTLYDETNFNGMGLGI